MTEELVTNLSSYRLQLQQVEAAIEADPDNEELPKLKKDLEEMISLTESLVGSNASKKGSELKWKVSDRCKAIWSKDKQYYPARIGEILEDDTCTVIFDRYELTEIVDLASLRAADPEEPAYVSKSKSRKDHSAAGLEQKRKRFLKKAQRLKEHEDEREKEKNKWQQFNSKLFSKTNKGKVKKSIFASPEQTEGKVGVGTCGLGGKPMTKIRRVTKPN